jgi:hypothetical protein
MMMVIPANAGGARHGEQQLINIPTTDFTPSDWEYNSSPGQPYAPGTNDFNYNVSTDPSTGAAAISQGAFRFLCNHDHYNYDDPILAPGVINGSSHLHEWAGNFNGNYLSTYASLRASGNGSSCPGGPINRTAYWSPALIDPTNNKVVPFDDVQFYYKGNRYAWVDTSDNVPPPSVISISVVGPPARILPRGLRYIFGFNISGNSGAGSNDSNFTWSCSDVSEGLHSNLSIAPNHDDPWTLVDLYARLTALGIQSDGVHCLTIVSRGDAPTCWTGQLDSPDHFSHVNGSASFVNGKFRCAGPIGSLVNFSGIFTYQRGTADFSLWYLSSDRAVGHNTFANGQTFHQDWFGAWDYPTFAYALQNSDQFLNTFDLTQPSPTGSNIQNNSGGVMGDLGLSVAGAPGNTGGGGVIISGGIPAFPDNELAIPTRAQFLSPANGCVQADNFLARTSLTGTDASNVATFICGMVSDGLITGQLLRQFDCGPKFDAIWLFDQPDQKTSNLNICGTYYTVTPHGSPAWSATGGYTGVDGSTTVYLDPGMVSFTGQSNFIHWNNDSSSHLTAWSNTSSQDTGGVAIGFNNGGSQFNWIRPRYATNVADYQIATTTLDTPVATTDGSGFYGVARNAHSGAGSLLGYKSTGSGITQVFSGSQTALTSGLQPYILASNEIGSPAHGTSKQIASASVGANLSSTDMANFCHRLNVFHTARFGAASVC